MKIVAFQTPGGIRYAIKKGWLFPKYKDLSIGHSIIGIIDKNEQWCSMSNMRHVKWCLTDKYEVVEKELSRLQANENFKISYKEIPISKVEQIVLPSREEKEQK
jgi:hypothetical protein